MFDHARRLPRTFAPVEFYEASGLVGIYGPWANDPQACK